MSSGMVLKVEAWMRAAREQDSKLSISPRMITTDNNDDESRGSRNSLTARTIPSTAAPLRQVRGLSVKFS